MAASGHVYGEVNNKTGLKKIFTHIRRDVAGAKSRPSLSELYKRAGYLITLTYSPAWDKKFGTDANTLRRLGQEEFQKTAKKINSRAKQIGAKADFDEKWGK